MTTVKTHHRLIIAIAIAMVPLFFSKRADANTHHLSDAGQVMTMQECLNCHDRSSKKPVVICTGDMCLYSRNHSLMRIYPPPRQERDYASIAEIQSAGCVLENGRTTCLSCHDLTKPPPRLILDGDALCYLCHKALRPSEP